MPELPEIETLVRSLRPLLIGNRIITVWFSGQPLRFPLVPDDFDRWVISQEIHAVDRRGKYLIIRLQNQAALVLHLGMSGRLSVVPAAAEIEKHTHVVFDLLNNRQMRYRDPRRFGLVEVVAPASLAAYVRFAHLGVEPLSAAFTAEYLLSLRGRQSIKSRLMDAGFVVGVGNIYANEALFHAGVSPIRPVHSIDKAEAERIVQAVCKVLRDAIQRGGTTLNDFRSAEGEPGFFQLELSVYGRHEQPCLACGTAIKKITLAGRSTFYCPRCQK